MWILFSPTSMFLFSSKKPHERSASNSSVQRRKRMTVDFRATVDFPALWYASSDQLQRAPHFLTQLRAALTAAQTSASISWAAQNEALVQLFECMQRDRDLLGLTTSVAVYLQFCPPPSPPLDGATTTEGNDPAGTVPCTSSAGVQEGALVPYGLRTPKPSRPLPHDNAPQAREKWTEKERKEWEKKQQKEKEEKEAEHLRPLPLGDVVDPSGAPTAVSPVVHFGKRLRPHRLDESLNSQFEGMALRRGVEGVSSSLSSGDATLSTTVHDPNERSPFSPSAAMRKDGDANGEAEKKGAAASSLPTPFPPLLQARSAPKMEEENAAAVASSSSPPPPPPPPKSAPSIASALPEWQAKLPLPPLSFPYAEFLSTIWSAFDPRYPIGVQRRALESLELFTTALVGEEACRQATEYLLQQGDAGLEEDDRVGFDRHVIHEVFPLLLLGVLSLLPLCSMQIKIPLLDFTDKVLLFLSPSAVRQCVEGVLLIVFPLLEEAEGSELHHRGLRLLGCIRRKLCSGMEGQDEGMSLVYAILWRLLTEVPSLRMGLWVALLFFAQYDQQLLAVQEKEVLSAAAAASARHTTTTTTITPPLSFASLLSSSEPKRHPHHHRHGRAKKGKRSTQPCYLPHPSDTHSCPRRTLESGGGDTPRHHPKNTENGAEAMPPDDHDQEEKKDHPLEEGERSRKRRAASLPPPSSSPSSSSRPQWSRGSTTSHREGAKRSASASSAVSISYPRPTAVPSHCPSAQGARTPHPTPSLHSASSSSSSFYSSSSSCASSSRHSPPTPLSPPPLSSSSSSPPPLRVLYHLPLCGGDPRLVYYAVLYTFLTAYSNGMTPDPSMIPRPMASTTTAAPPPTSGGGEWGSSETGGVVRRPPPPWRSGRAGSASSSVVGGGGGGGQTRAGGGSGGTSSAYESRMLKLALDFLLAYCPLYSFLLPPCQGHPGASGLALPTRASATALVGGEGESPSSSSFFSLDDVSLLVAAALQLTASPHTLPNVSRRLYEWMSTASLRTAPPGEVRRFSPATQYLYAAYQRQYTLDGHSPRERTMQTTRTKKPHGDEKKAEEDPRRGEKTSPKTIKKKKKKEEERGSTHRRLLLCGGVRQCGDCASFFPLLQPCRHYCTPWARWWHYMMHPQAGSLLLVHAFRLFIQWQIGDPTIFFLGGSSSFSCKRGEKTPASSHPHRASTPMSIDVEDEEEKRNDTSASAPQKTSKGDTTPEEPPQKGLKTHRKQERSHKERPSSRAPCRRPRHHSTSSSSSSSFSSRASSRSSGCFPFPRPLFHEAASLHGGSSSSSSFFFPDMVDLLQENASTSSPPPAAGVEVFPSSSGSTAAIWALLAQQAHHRIATLGPTAFLPTEDARRPTKAAAPPPFPIPNVRHPPDGAASCGRTPSPLPPATLLRNTPKEEEADEGTGNGRVFSPTSQLTHVPKEGEGGSQQPRRASADAAAPLAGTPLHSEDAPSPHHAASASCPASTLPLPRPLWTSPAASEDGRQAPPPLSSCSPPTATAIEERRCQRPDRRRRTPLRTAVDPSAIPRPLLYPPLPSSSCFSARYATFVPREVQEREEEEEEKGGVGQWCVQERPSCRTRRPSPHHFWQTSMRESAGASSSSFFAERDKEEEKGGGGARRREGAASLALLWCRIFLQLLPPSSSSMTTPHHTKEEEERGGQMRMDRHRFPLFSSSSSAAKEVVPPFLLLLSSPSELSDPARPEENIGDGGNEGGGGGGGLGDRK